MSQGFRPRSWLANAHLQTILPTLPPLRGRTLRRAAELRRIAEEWLLDCGDGVRLQAWRSGGAVGADRTALLLHGWEGSAESSYVLSLAAALHGAGYEVVRLNLRDHGDTHHLNRDLFHSCRLPEVVGAVQAVAARCAGRRLFLAGFSLGGNFFLRVAAAAGLPASVAGVVAISPVLDPARAMLALEQGPLYHGYFVRKWSRSLHIKQRHWPGHYDFAALFARPSLRAMTAALVASHTDYPSMDDYLAGYAITGSRLATLAVPAAILAAEDDPIIPAEDLARLAQTPHLTIERSARGGHCGFLPSFREPGYANAFTLQNFERFAIDAGQFTAGSRT